MIRIGMLSKWHVHAQDYAAQVKDSGKAKIVAVWDDNVSRGQDWANELGVDFVADLDAFLKRDDIDAVICDTATTMHTEVLVKAAQAGKHIFTEKVLATTVEDCITIANSIREANVQFAISFPQLVFPDVQVARTLLQNNELGDVSNFRMRNAHAGLLQGWLPDYWMNVDEAGGGALMDLGAHPVYLANAFFGEPKRVSAVMSAPLNGTDPKADEAATVLVEYEGGKAAVLETSLISWNSPRILELYGTEGSYLSINGEVDLNLKTYDASDYRRIELPERDTMPLDLFFEAIETGTRVSDDFGLDAAINLTKVMVAAYQSVEEGRFIEL